MYSYELHQIISISGVVTCASVKFSAFAGQVKASKADSNF